MADKSTQLLYKVIRILFGIICCGTILIVVFVDKKVAYSELCKLNTGISNLWIWIGAMCLTAMAFMMARSKALERFCVWIGQHFGRCLFVMSACLLAVQFLIAYEIYFVTGWDAGIVFSVANDVATGNGGVGDFYYYSQYVNNIPITFVLAAIQKLSMIVGLGSRSYFVCVAVGCFLVNLACVFTGLAIEKLTDAADLGLLGFVLMSLVAGISPWITIPYTDTYSVIFPPLTFYLFLCAGEKKGYQAVWYYFLTGLCGGMGYLIKPSAGIVLIAVIGILIFRIFTQKEAKVKVFWHILCIVAALCLTWAIREGMTSYLRCDLNKDLQFSMTHYLMMGLNEENTGGYYSPDYGFSSSFATRKERTQGNLQVVFERLEEFGFWGYGHFLVKKLLTNYNDGTFSWWMEGSFFQKDMGHQSSVLQQILRNFYYKEGKWYSIYAVFAQGCWIAVQTMGAISLWNRRAKCLYGEMVMRLTLVGMFLFVMLFEARGRYLYCMLGMYCICAAIGWRQLGMWIRSFSTKEMDGIENEKDSNYRSRTGRIDSSL